MSPTEGYFLRFPFKLPEGQKISKLEQPYDFQYEEKNIQLVADNENYSFKLGKFPEERKGQAFIPILWAGLMWALINRGMAASASLETQDVKYFGDPYGVGKNLGFKDKKIDGLIDASSPAIFESDKDISVISGSPGSLIQGFSPDITAQLMTELFSLPCPEKIVADKKLKVSLDLYTAFYWESSQNARFVTLNMALEALSPKSPKHECASNLVSRWMIEVEKLKSSVQKDSEEWHAYDSLKREIGFRKEASIRSSIRNLVLTTLSGKEPAAKELAKRAVKLYDIRSTLVHEGHPSGHDLGNCISELKDIVNKVLKARFMNVASSTAQ